MTYIFDHIGNKIVPLRETKLDGSPVNTDRIKCPIARECWQMYNAAKGGK